MKKIIILILIFLLPLVTSTPFKVFYLNAEIFRNDTVVLKELKVIPSTVSDYPVFETNYKIKIYSYNKELLWEENLPVYFYVNLEEFGNILLDKTLINMNLPYFEDAKNIVILHEEKEIANFEISKYVCKKNNICEFGESKFNCPQDCTIKEALKYIILICLFLAVFAYIFMKKFLGAR